MNTRLCVVACCVVLAAACADRFDSPSIPTAPVRTPRASSASIDIVDGRVGPGSLYRLARPDNWNGDLIVYAHGYVPAGQPLVLPPEGDQFISQFGAQGFALAFSSFSENGWDVKDGTTRTHQLLGIFTSKFGRPNRVYVGGASMGGLIAIRLAETYPTTYVGTLAACPIAGGTRGLFEYHSHVRALFDVFYPGVLPGNAAYLPPGTDVNTQILAPAVAAMTGNPGPALQIALIDQTPVPFATPAELAQSIITALAGNAADLADVVLIDGKPYFDNRSTVYSSAVLPPALLAAVNATIGRFSASPAALAAFDHNYTPSGDLRTPMVMLSNTRDPVVPGFSRASYLAAVAAQGASSLVVERQVPGYGHCALTPAEIGTAFADLVLWVQFGIKPAP